MVQYIKFLMPSLWYCIILEGQNLYIRYQMKLYYKRKETEDGLTSFPGDRYSLTGALWVDGVDIDCVLLVLF